MTIAVLEEKRIDNYRKNVNAFSKDLLEAGKIANPENPYLWVAERFEIMSEWGIKDWEVIFKRKLTFQEVRSAQITFKKMSETLNEQIARWYKNDM